MYQIEFTIGGLPKNINNARMQWFIRHKENKKWKGLVALAIGVKTPPSPLAKAKLTLIRHSSSEPDFDGLVASFKSIIDGLIECRVLENDRMSNIGQPDYKWKKAKPGAGMITVKVEEIR